MSAVQFSFSKKQKILLFTAVPAAILINLFVGRSQEVGRLTAQLDRGSIEQQVAAADQLAQLGSSADGALGQLAVATRSNDAALRAAAMRAVIRIDRAEAVSILEQAFSSKSVGVRIDAAEALASMGSKRAQRVLERSQNHAQESYERARLEGWADGIRREFQKEKKDAYRRHRKIYGD